MNRAIALLIIGLVFGGGLGFVLAAANGVTLDGHDHATDHGPAAVEGHEVAAHNHDEMLHLAADADAPTLAARLHDDPVSGWNLEIVTTGFAFAPENAGLENADGEGHAHLYVNGEKISRIYGNWTHIGTLPEGQVEILVTLNTNDHRALAVGDKPLAAMIMVQN